MSWPRRPRFSISVRTNAWRAAGSRASRSTFCRCVVGSVANTRSGYIAMSTRGFASSVFGLR